MPKSEAQHRNKKKSKKKDIRKQDPRKGKPRKDVRKGKSPRKGKSSRKGSNSKKGRVIETVTIPSEGTMSGRKDRLIRSLPGWVILAAMLVGSLFHHLDDIERLTHDVTAIVHFLIDHFGRH